MKDEIAARGAESRHEARARGCASDASAVQLPPDEICTLRVQLVKVIEQACPGAGVALSMRSTASGMRSKYGRQRPFLFQVTRNDDGNNYGCRSNQG